MSSIYPLLHLWVPLNLKWNGFYFDLFFNVQVKKIAYERWHIFFQVDKILNCASKYLHFAVSTQSKAYKEFAMVGCNII